MQYLDELALENNSDKQDRQYRDMETAMSCGYGWNMLLLNLAMLKGRVIISSLVATSNGQRKLFQLCMKSKDHQR